MIAAQKCFVWSLEDKLVKIGRVIEIEILRGKTYDGENTINLGYAEENKRVACDFHSTPVLFQCLALI